MDGCLKWTPHKKLIVSAHVPVHIFLGGPVALESICYRMTANRLMYESKTTGGLKQLFGCKFDILLVNKKMRATFLSGIPIQKN